MKPRYMLDTNICIYIAKHQPPAVKARFERLKPGQLVDLNRQDRLMTQAIDESNRVELPGSTSPGANTSNDGRNSINIWRRWILSLRGRTMARRDAARLKNRHRLEEFTTRPLTMTSIAIQEEPLRPKQI